MLQVEEPISLVPSNPSEAENRNLVYFILWVIQNRPNELKGKRLKITRSDGLVIDVRITESSGDDTKIRLRGYNEETCTHFDIFISHFFIGDPVVERLY